MSTPTEQDTSSTLEAIKAVMGLFRPSADISNTDTTKALEMGLESVMPHDTPFT